jgi:serine/threonine-protein kinase
VIGRALAKRPEDRFSSAADFAAAMKAVLDGAAALPASLAGPADAPTHRMEAGTGRSLSPLPPTSSDLPLPPAAQRPQQSIGLLVGVGLAFLVVGALLAVFIMRLTHP